MCVCVCTCMYHVQVLLPLDDYLDAGKHKLKLELGVLPGNSEQGVITGFVELEIEGKRSIR